MYRLTHGMSCWHRHSQVCSSIRYKCGSCLVIRVDSSSRSRHINSYKSNLGRQNTHAYYIGFERTGEIGPASRSPDLSNTWAERVLSRACPISLRYLDVLDSIRHLRKLKRMATVAIPYTFEQCRYHGSLCCVQASCWKYNISLSSSAHSDAA